MKNYLQELSIQNFESHKDTHITFHEGVNVIIGNSDKGKSSILRAISLVLFNFPSGTAFRSWWGGTTKIKTIFPEITIQRIRDDNENSYISDSYEKPFKAIGKGDPPEEIIKELNVDRELNVQAQIDPLFLLSNSPGEVARHFNKVSGLFKIDLTLKNATQDINKTKTKISTTKDRQTELNEELQKYKKVDNALTIIEKGEEIEKHLNELNTRKNFLFSLIKNLEEIENMHHEINKMKEQYKLIHIVQKIIKIKKKIHAKKITKKELQNKISKMNELKESIKKNSKKHNLLPVVNRCLQLKKGIEKIKSTQESYKSFLKFLQTTKNELQELKTKQSTLQIKFNKEMPETCPLCNQNIMKQL